MGKTAKATAVEKRGRGPGGPRSPLESRILVRFRPADFVRYTSIATARGMSLSSWVRQSCYLAASLLTAGKARAVPLGAGQQLSMRTQIRLRPSEIEAWTQLANARGLRLSEWMRQACAVAAEPS
jgi:hypothetical protein